MHNRGAGNTTTITTTNNNNNSNNNNSNNNNNNNKNMKNNNNDDLYSAFSPASAVTQHSYKKILQEYAATCTWDWTMQLYFLLSPQWHQKLAHCCEQRGNHVVKCSISWPQRVFRTVGPCWEDLCRKPVTKKINPFGEMQNCTVSHCFYLRTLFSWMSYAVLWVALTQGMKRTQTILDAKDICR